MEIFKAFKPETVELITLKTTSEGLKARHSEVIKAIVRLTKSRDNNKQATAFVEPGEDTFYYLNKALRVQGTTYLIKALTVGRNHQTGKKEHYRLELEELEGYEG